MPVQIGQKPDRDFTQPLGLLSDCHRRIERFLGILASVSTEVRGGEMNEEQRLALENALQYFREAAPKHTADEELSLFPRLRATGNSEVDQVIADVQRLELDHAHAEQLHREIDELGTAWMRAGTLPPETAEHLQSLIDVLQAMYTTHIETEDMRVFPVAVRVLSPDLQREIGREMAARRSSQIR